MADLNKESLEHLVKLARLELTPEEEHKYFADLGKILDHFKELQELDTKDVQPMTGGTQLKNVFRQDDERAGDRKDAIKENIQARFPEQEKGFLKVPPVFSAEGGE